MPVPHPALRRTSIEDKGDDSAASLARIFSFAFAIVCLSEPVALHSQQTAASPTDTLVGGMPLRREFDRLFEADARNVFLVKISYWIGS